MSDLSIFLGSSLSRYLSFLSQSLLSWYNKWQAYPKSAILLQTLFVESKTGSPVFSDLGLGKSYLTNLSSSVSWRFIVLATLFTPYPN